MGPGSGLGLALGRVSAVKPLPAAEPDHFLVNHPDLVVAQAGEGIVHAEVAVDPLPVAEVAH